MLRTAPLLLALALLAGCASVSVQRGPGTPAPSAPTSPASQLADEGRHAEAARAYAAQAEQARGDARARAWLRAAWQHQLANQPEAARAAFANAPRRRLEGQDELLHDLLNAGFRLEAGQAEAALALLGQRRETVPDAYATSWHQLRADALRRLGRGFDAAGDLAWLAVRQLGEERVATVGEIVSLLSAESDAALSAKAAALPVGHPLYAYAGRALSQRGLPLPRPYDRSGSTPGLDALPRAEFDGYRPPERLAALLPLTGPLAAAGQSVRDGMLAGYYAESRRRPALRFYDTGAPGGLRAALANATRDGAQMLVGPLSRDEVNELFASPELSLPTVALNRGSHPPTPGSASYALAPEDEGVAAAERLLQRGLRRVLVVSQADETAQRSLAAFRDHMRARGGEIIGEVSMQSGNPEIVPALQRAVQSAGGLRPEALFLSLKAAEARLLASQVEPAGLAGVPRVATSLILSGANLRMDTELDGIEYPELPWLIGLRGGLPDPDTLGSTLPSAQGGGARLFAFGLDAWKLAVYLDKLVSDPGALVRGATGELTLDATGQVRRAPAWAVFSGGRPRPAPDGALYQDNGAPASDAGTP
ncbi:penicillin-binding protein activator [Arenimonas soli]|uniref:Penicillin-binding protein activator n=1 Tax=Arenimonas soli TaxID=2269504 RepID=A0ABQ1HQ66_9GAMM|nr:penicillin-binding protein activator [Arenimonas soli]GGA84853.1 penicillin-binding protein activator [Arenimonas soli]